MAFAEFAHIGVDGSARQLAVEYRRLDELVPYARNARTHSEAQISEIAGAIREFGFTNPVLIAEDGTLIAGHGRVLAARKLGMETVPAIVLTGLSEIQRRALVLADNRIAMNAGWDEDLLALELSDLHEAGFDLGLTGFNDDELQDLLYGMPAKRRSEHRPNIGIDKPRQPKQQAATRSTPWRHSSRSSQAAKAGSSRCPDAGCSAAQAASLSAPTPLRILSTASSMVAA